MPRWRYSVQVDPEKSARAMVWDAPISYKKAVELARVLKGMRVEEARRLLERVIRLEEPIPVRRYHGKQAHHRGLADKYGWPAGRYPVKAAKIIMKVLENAVNNAEQKGLDTSRLKIVHIGVHKGVTLKRWMPRAFGRATPKWRRRSHIEIIVAEEE